MARFVSSVALGALAGLVAGWDISVKSTGGNATSGHQYGFLHEDINHSGDGGIYAELIRNRAFQYTEPYFSLTMDGWYSINDAELSLERLSEPLSEQLPVSMKVAPSKSDGEIGFFNDGFWGMDVKQQTYTGSFWVKGAYDGVFTASLQSNLTDDVFGTVEIESRSVADDWTEHEFELVPTKDAPNSNNTFALTFDSKGAESGSLDFNLISLFPPTYKNRKNGLRIDLAEAMEELHPKLLRFPGGGMLQGHDNDNYWDWKDTLGPLRYRKGFAGRWGYHQTHGLGMMEYLEWAEDMDLVLMPVVWAGAAFDDNPVPPEELQPYIDDALNQVEFIRGSVDTPWGARRAELGHPEPFKLEYLQISNEDWLPGPNSNQSYIDYRFPMFLEAVTDRYPDLQVISSCSPFEGHDVPAPAWADYHPYRKPDELVDEFDYMDNQIPHIVGEVAATHVNGGEGWSGAGRLHTFPWWIGTVGEAISMIGYERNADKVATVLYAPVLRNMNSWAWAITIIQFAADPAMTTRSTSWYLWELFAKYTMTTTLPTEGEFDPLFYVAGRNEDKGTFIWKGAAYNTTEPIPVSLSFEGVREGHEAVLTKLTTEDNDGFAYNDPHLGNQVVDTEETILVANEDGAFEFEMTELSIAVLETRPRKCIPRPRAS